MNRIVGSSLVAVAALTSIALAATGTPERLRGTVAAIGAKSLTINATNGAPVTVALDGKTVFLKVEKSSLGKITKGSYIGTATKTVGSKLVALEVVVFPPAMRGVGEGHYAWDKLPDTTLSGKSTTTSTMTNGNVAAITNSARVKSTMTNGNVATARDEGGDKHLVVTYKGGKQDIMVPPTAPIVTFRRGSRADVTKGAAVFIKATKNGDGIVANAVAFGVDGVKPPM